ncbi:PqqD family protein [Ancylobacter polymorphus]|uniref:Uncharacterized protein n=1 Tax=Ancylobacter polymorphus TaxID=223390 RepID=A0ABU0B5W6_9HYPH|nr:PqqD family protein [Ancylobacter polymorphus]MDQ0301205.1 hypothetical protein [Ancylobacter polymorphus]
MAALFPGGPRPAARAWRHGDRQPSQRGLEQPVEIGQLCAELARLYDGPPDDIQRDVLAFFSGTAERKLILPADAPAA